MKEMHRKKPLVLGNIKELENSRKALILIEEDAITLEVATIIVNFLSSVGPSSDFFTVANKNLKETVKLIQKNHSSIKKRDKFEQLEGKSSDNWKAYDEIVKMEAEVIKTKQGELRQYFLDNFDKITKLLSEQHKIDLLTYHKPTDELINSSLLEKKIATLPHNTNYNMIYIGGGHGDEYSLSNIPIIDAERLINQISKKGIRGNTIMLGSCDSVLHSPMVNQYLGHNESIVIAAIGDCGNNFSNEIMNYLLNEGEGNFFKIANYQEECFILGTTLSILQKDSMVLFNFPSSLAVYAEDSVNYWNVCLAALLKERLQAAMNQQDLMRTVPNIIIVGGEDDCSISKSSLLETHYNSFQEPLYLYDNETLTFPLAEEKKVKIIEDFFKKNSIKITDELPAKLLSFFPTIEMIKFSDRPVDRIQVFNEVIAAFSGLSSENELLKALEAPINKEKLGTVTLSQVPMSADKIMDFIKNPRKPPEIKTS